MGKRTAKELEQDYRKDQRGFFLRCEQIFSSPAFRDSWEKVEEIWAQLRKATEEYLKAQNEIDRRDQLKVIVQTPQGPQSVTEPFPVKKTPSGDIVGDADPENQKGNLQNRLIKRLADAESKYSELKDAYDQSLGEVRRQFGIPELLGPHQGKTLADLRGMDFDRFMKMPGLVENQEPVRIIFPRPPKGKDDFSSTALFNEKILLLAVNMDHPNRALLAALDGAIRYVREKLPAAKGQRLNLKAQEFRTKALDLRAERKRRKEIAESLLPDEMRSKNPIIRKRALQRVSDALKPRKR